MRKDNGSPAISLFSFQDIITSITGIMFLVVLLLILLIFESNPVEKNKNTEQVEDKHLAEQVAALEKEIDSYRKQILMLKQQLEEYQKMPTEKILQRKQHLTDSIIRIRQTIQQLNQKKNQELNREKQLLARQEKLQKMQKKLEADLKVQQEEIEKTQKLLEQTQQRFKTIRQTVKFSVEQQSSRNYLLAELTTDGVRVLDMGTQKTYDLRRKGTSLQEQIRILRTWLGSRSRSSESLSVILAPSQLKNWVKIDKMLNEEQFHHGLELYPADHMSIFDGGEK